jgi:DNA repair protein RecO (recombination protein O)
MQIEAYAIVCGVKPHAEHGAIVRCLTEEHGLLAGYVQGARSKTMRPLLIPGNVIAGVWRQRTANQLASLTLESVHSRGHLLGEALAAAAIEWATALTAASLPEALPYPRLHSALDGVLTAIENAPSARGWAKALADFETLLISKLGYGAEEVAEQSLAKNRARLVRHILGDRQDMLAARERLVERLKKAVA